MNELSLAGKWDLKPEGNIYNTDMGLNYSPSVNFPGDIQTAILEANPGFDPYYRDNELKFQVPGQTYWTCTRTINVPKKLIPYIGLLTKVLGKIAEKISITATLIIGFFSQA